KKVVRIVYTGSIYVGKQDPSPLFSALHNLKAQKKLSPERLQVIFAGATVDKVKSVAKLHDVEEFCQFLGFLSREDALRMQRDCDALLFLEYVSPGVDGILTGKLFEYLFSGRPILGVGGTEKTSAGALIVKSGRGQALGVEVEP